MSSSAVLLATDKDLGSDEDIEIKRILESETSRQVVIFDWRDQDKQRLLFQRLKDEDVQFVVIIRSTWDYHLHAEEFKLWIRNLEKNHIHLHNPGDILEWNLHKHYLFDLEEYGLPIIPTASFDNDLGLNKFFDQFNCTEIVIKPSTSAGSHHTKRISKADFNDPEKQKLINSELAQWIEESGPENLDTYIIQPFIKEIATLGEISLLFINHEFSHSIIKKPRKGDWLVQQMYGGTADPFECDEIVLQLGQKALEAIRYNKNDGKPLLYARVDVIQLANEGTEKAPQYLISEIELIEPYFFLHCAPQPEVAYHSFIAAIENTFDNLSDSDSESETD